PPPLRLPHRRLGRPVQSDLVKITKVTTERVAVTRRGIWQFVRVHTDDGLTGLGEASQGGNDAAVTQAIDQLVAPAVSGQNPLDVEPLFQRLKRLGADRAGATALSAVEQALWDIAGQAYGQP